MSIRIQKSKCVGCGRCIEACPGNLIKRTKKAKPLSVRSETAGDALPVSKNAAVMPSASSLELMWRQRRKHGCIRET